MRRAGVPLLRIPARQHAMLSAGVDTKIAAGKSHHAAVRALAYKWIRVLFRCWKDGRPYDERTYLQTLAERNSPLNWGAGASTKPVWKTVGGFKKLSTENS